MKKVILILNFGSSSLKLALFENTPAGLQEIERKIIEGRPEDALRKLLEWLDSNIIELTAIGHRIVHGGDQYDAPILLNSDSIHYLETLIPLAPLHQIHNLIGVKTLARLYPNLPQIACFDTSFHTTQSAVSTSFALPSNLGLLPIKRYGFHGLSYEYITKLFRSKIKVQNSRIIIAHLGHGASLCAVKNGKSIATTMGFTALDGLPMATRCGALDPGVVIYLYEHLKMNMNEIKDLLYEKSGLLGLSGISGDIRHLLNHTDPAAQFAIDVFVYRICREIGSLIAALGGIEQLIFTAGIGEHAASIRKLICNNLDWLEVALDSKANEANEFCISSASSKIGVWVIPTNEERVIAEKTLNLIK